MKITVVAAVVALVGCGQVEDGTAPASAPDSGVMMAAGGTGGVSGTGGGPASTGGTGGSGGAVSSTGGTGGAVLTAPDAGAPKPSPDAQPSSGGPPQACMVSQLRSFVCLSPPNSPDGKVLRKDGYACNLCATYKSDGRTVERYYTGCIPAPGAICVMDCSECK